MAEQKTTQPSDSSSTPQLQPMGEYHQMDAKPPKPVFKPQSRAPKPPQSKTK